jgi:hypothetical protein
MSIRFQKKIKRHITAACRQPANKCWLGCPSASRKTLYASVKQKQSTLENESRTKFFILVVGKFCFSKKFAANRECILQNCLAGFVFRNYLQ